MIDRRLPKLPATSPRMLDLDASIAVAINHNFRQMEAVTARRDAESAGASLLRRVTGQEFDVRLQEPR
jgi:hypothetical protein